ncbi:hypothetical protein C8R45DRAFT_928819 [Mycena sanguinolenta]|nr:hypothetical protein C8R45DRAFT_928819 [Mycena sanguinolenta]
MKSGRIHPKTPICSAPPVLSRPDRTSIQTVMANLRKVPDSGLKELTDLVPHTPTFPSKCKRDKDHPSLPTLLDRPNTEGAYSKSTSLHHRAEAPLPAAALENDALRERRTRGRIRKAVICDRTAPCSRAKSGNEEDERMETDGSKENISGGRDEPKRNQSRLDASETENKPQIPPSQRKKKSATHPQRRRQQSLARPQHTS